MKTYVIKKDSEWVEDHDDRYILKENEWEGNLHIILDKRVCTYLGENLIVHGDLKVEKNIDVGGNLMVDGNVIVNDSLDGSGYISVGGYIDARVYVNAQEHIIVGGYIRSKGEVSSLYRYINVGGYIWADSILAEGCITVGGGVIKELDCYSLFCIKKETLEIDEEEKTWSEWDEWFASDEECDKKRGTREFKLLQNAFETAKVYKNIFDIWKRHK